MVPQNNRIIALVIFICFLFIFCAYAKADKVLLRNGNTLEGKIIREDSDALWFEIYMESGSSKTKISKSRIKSIEHSEIIEPSRAKTAQPYGKLGPRLSQKEIEESVKKLKMAVAAMAGLFFAVLAIPFFILNLLSKIKLERPFGFKIICLWVSYSTVLLFLAGVMNIVLGMKGGAFDFKSGNTFIFLLLNIGIPFCVFTLLIGLVYLRWWGRIFLIILLILGIAAQAAELAFKKNLIGAAVGASWQNIGSRWLSAFRLQRNPLGAATKWYAITLFVLMLLYLNRKQVRDAFVQASQYKLSQIIGKTRLIITSLVIAILIFAVDKSYKPALRKLTENPYFITFQEVLKGAAMKQSSSEIVSPSLRSGS